MPARAPSRPTAARTARLLAEVEQAAAALGFRVRYELGTFVGGACTVGDERQIVLSRRLAPSGRLTALSAALAAAVPDLEAVSLLPAVRQLLDAAKTEAVDG